MAIDPFVLLAPILLLAVIALLRFTGCFIKPSPPAPTIMGFDPPDATAGDGVSTPFELTVNGSNFAQDAKVKFGNTDLTPAAGSVTDTVIKVTVAATELANARDVHVTVTNGDGGTSAPQTYTIYELIQVTFNGMNPPPTNPPNNSLATVVYKNLDFTPGGFY